MQLILVHVVKSVQLHQIKWETRYQLVKARITNLEVRLLPNRYAYRWRKETMKRLSESTLGT